MDGIDAFLQRSPDAPVVLDLLGTVDASEIRARVHELDPEIREVFFSTASVGALFGVVRSDRRRAAIKIHKLFSDEAYFDDV